MSVELFCSVSNDIYSKMFIFGAIMTKMNKSEHFSKVFRYDYKHFRMAPKHLRRMFTNFCGSI